MWVVNKSDPYVWPPRTLDGPVDDPARQERMLQAMSAFWNVAFHALFFLDADLSYDQAGWVPPPPFDARAQDAFVVPPVYSRKELLDYCEFSRSKTRGVFRDLTDEQAAAPLPEPHRYSGDPFADRLVGNLMHLQEHTAQLRQSLNQLL